MLPHSSILLRCTLACGLAVALFVAASSATAEAQSRDPVALAVGSGFACGLGANGEVRCWGDAASGQTGTLAATLPGTPPSLALALPAPAVAIVAGHHHACARLANGTIACWGDNRYGQIGVDGIASRAEPALLQGLPGIVDVALGSFFGCAISVERTVYCWGDNTYRQLGSSARGFRTTPTAVRALRDVRTLAVGANHACVIGADGKVKCWGSNDWGQLGRGRRGGTAGPTEIRELRGAVALTLGKTFTCGRMPGGELLCTGQNVFGGPDPAAQIYPRPVPVAVGGVGVLSSSAGLSENLCVVGADHQLRCAGVSRHGQLHPTEPNALGTMTVYPGLVDVTDVVVADEALCVFSASGPPRCAGHGTEGQLGTGRSEDSRVLTPVRWERTGS